MSHFAKYEVKVSRLDFIKQALVEMGYSYKENGTVRTDFGESRKAKLVVVRDGKPISVGFCENKQSGELELIADWWGLRIPEKEFTNKLSQLHSKYQVLETCEENRWNVDEDDIVVNDAGEIEILATQWI